MTNPITPETVREALASASVTPHARIRAMATDIARAYLDTMEENARMRDALEQLDASCTCREGWSGRKRQDPECPAGDYGDIARAGLGLPPRCQFNIRIAALRDLKGGE